MLSRLFTLLEKAGVQRVHGGGADKRPSGISFHDWHSRLIQSVGEQADPVAFKQLGRSFDVMAAEIFLAQVDHDTWGWAEAKSMSALDYWSDFDPSLIFILGSITPESFLTRCLCDAQQEESWSSAIDEWKSCHTKILDFSKRLPMRCLLVDIEDALSNPKEFIRQVNHVSGAQLMALENAKENHVTEPWQQSPIAFSLARAYLANRSDVHSLVKALANQSESRTIRTRLASRLASPNLERLVADFKGINKGESGRITSLRTELGDLSSENDLLLAQLHQVQEELERYYLENIELKHSSKEAITRLTSFQSTYPHLFTYKSCKKVALPATKELAIRERWSLTNLDGAGRQYETLDFDLVLKADTAGLCFRRASEPSQSTYPPVFQDWADDASDYWICPWNLKLEGNTRNSNSSSSRSRKKKLRNDFSCSDWIFLRGLVAWITFEVSLKPSTRARRIQQGLKNLDRWLNNQVSILRFDALDVHTDADRMDYACLRFQLTNVSLDSRRSETFAFRLATVPGPQGDFHANPRLEFPSDTGVSLFEGWFLESANEFGNKLEVRFASPHALDMGVFTKLPESDQHLIMELVALVRRWLFQQESAPHPAFNAIERWGPVVQVMQSALALTKKPPSQRRQPNMKTKGSTRGGSSRRKPTPTVG